MGVLQIGITYLLTFFKLYNVLAMLFSETLLADKRSLVFDGPRVIFCLQRAVSDTKPEVVSDVSPEAVSDLMTPEAVSDRHATPGSSVRHDNGSGVRLGDTGSIKNNKHRTHGKVNKNKMAEQY